MKSILAALIALWLGVAGGAAVAGPVTTPHVTTELAAQTADAAPGSTLYVAVILTAEKGWHTYWRNPGDAGEATKITWTLPAGWRAGDIVWPTPQRLPVGPIMNYGYEGRVVLAVPIEIPASAAPGQSVTLVADVDYLVCAEVCVPGSAKVSLSVPIVAGAPAVDPTWGKTITDTLAAAPKPAGLAATFQHAGPHLTLAIAGAPLAGVTPTDVYFYPYQDTLIDQAKPQAVERGPRGLTLALTPGTAFAGAGPAKAEGVLAVDGKTYELSAPPGPPPAGAAGLGALAEAGGGGLGLPLALGFALPGRLEPQPNALRLPDPLHEGRRPGAARGGRRGARRRRRLPRRSADRLRRVGRRPDRRSGGRVGGGLGIPASVAVGCHPAGPGDAGRRVQSLRPVRGRDLGPGTGWGPGGAWRLAGFAAHRRPGGGGGGAVHRPVHGASPRLRPHPDAGGGFGGVRRPGPGIRRPVHGHRHGPGSDGAPAASRTVDGRPEEGPGLSDVWGRRLADLGAVAADWFARPGAVAHRRPRPGPGGVAVRGGSTAAVQRRARALWSMGAAALSLIVALAAVSVGPFAPPTPTGSASATPSPGSLASTPYSPERLAALRAAGTPVLVNFTAAWCVTCQVNERVAFSSGDVAAAMRRAGAVYMVADWTNRDGAIAKALADQGRIGVPLYLYYGRGAATAKVLPQLLTPAILVDAFGGRD